MFLELIKSNALEHSRVAKLPIAGEGALEDVLHGEHDILLFFYFCLIMLKNFEVLVRKDGPCYNSCIVDLGFGRFKLLNALDLLAVFKDHVLAGWKDKKIKTLHLLDRTGKVPKLSSVF